MLPKVPGPVTPILHRRSSTFFTTSAARTAYVLSLPVKTVAMFLAFSVGRVVGDVGSNIPYAYDGCTSLDEISLVTLIDFISLSSSPLLFGS